MTRLRTTTQGVRRRCALAGVAALVCAAIAGVAYAAIPGTNGQISACYKKIGGSLRVIDAQAGAQCKPNEKPLKWNKKGPPGADGVSGWKVVRVLASFPPGFQGAVSAMCPTGRKPLGGGWFPVDNQGSLNVLGSFPADPTGGSGGPPTSPSDFQGWALYANNPNLGGGTATAIVYAVCATVP